MQQVVAIMQQVVAISHQHFGTTYLSNIQEETPEAGPNRLSQNVGKKLPPLSCIITQKKARFSTTSRQKPEITPEEGGSARHKGKYKVLQGSDKEKLWQDSRDVSFRTKTRSKTTTMNREAS